jgi:hypothetical protein
VKDKRAVLIGMMSEICMKSRMILNSIKREESILSLERACGKMARLESEMRDCLKKIERLSH